MREIVITVGYPGSGKTTHIQKYLNKGYVRINRDTLGLRAKMDKVHDKLNSVLRSTNKSVVLDNTYATVESRKPVVTLADVYDVPVRVDWLTASLENAQFLASLRMIRKYGKLLGPKEIKAQKDPNCFPPIAQYGYRKRFEEPTVEEGFESITKVPFKLNLPDYSGSAFIFDYDGTLRDTKSGEKYPRKPSDVEILPGRKELFAQRFADVDYILGISNQSGVAKGKLSYQDAVDCFEKTNKLLNWDIEYVFCPHKAAPISCFCRKPGPGWGVHFVEKYKLDPSKVTFIGDMTSDKTFAGRCGFKFVYAKDFFGDK